MAVTMDLEERASDSKLHKESLVKKELRPSSAVSFSKSEHGTGLLTVSYTITLFLLRVKIACLISYCALFFSGNFINRAIKTI